VRGSVLAALAFALTGIGSSATTGCLLDECDGDGPITIHDGVYVTSSLLRPPSLDSNGPSDIKPPPHGRDRTRPKTLTFDAAKQTVLIEYELDGKKIVERYRIESTAH